MSNVGTFTARIIFRGDDWDGNKVRERERMGVKHETRAKTLVRNTADVPVGPTDC